MVCGFAVVGRVTHSRRFVSSIPCGFNRDEIVPLIGGFLCFWGNFHHFCDIPKSVIKFWGRGWEMASYRT